MTDTVTAMLRKGLDQELPVDLARHDTFRITVPVAADRGVFGDYIDISYDFDLKCLRIHGGSSLVVEPQVSNVINVKLKGVFE